MDNLIFLYSVCAQELFKSASAIYTGEKKSLNSNRKCETQIASPSTVSFFPSLFIHSLA